MAKFDNIRVYDNFEAFKVTMNLSATSLENCRIRLESNGYIIRLDGKIYCSGDPIKKCCNESVYCLKAYNIFRRTQKLDRILNDK